MKLNYSDIAFDGYGRVEIPELMLQTLHGDTIGIIPGSANIEINVKLSEPSELHFDVPAVIDGVSNPIYERITGHKKIYTTTYGIYETLNPVEDDDGVEIVKHVTAYSIEKALSGTRFFLEEGTYNFWNPALPSDTILGRIVEKTIDWHIGYVSPSLYNIYRTFEQVDDELLNFTYNTVDEKYQCCVVFDAYNMTINVYDRNVDLGALPIYLDHDNLIDNLNNEEKSEELVTAMRPYGADGLSIREVNPTGSPWIYDLTNFLENGDIPVELAAKWRAWELKIATHREYYIALISLRASTSARLLSEKAKLNELNGELEVLMTERNAIIQALGLATDSDRQIWQDRLTAKTAQISAKKSAIDDQQDLCDELEALLDPSDPTSYAAKIQDVVDDLAFENEGNFTAAEQTALRHYFIEQDLTEETFVATDIDTTISGQFVATGGSQGDISGEVVDGMLKLHGASVTQGYLDLRGNGVSVENGMLVISTGSSSSALFVINNAEITRIGLTDLQKTIYAITGGTFFVNGDRIISGQLIGGTIETGENNSFVLSVHCGSMTVNTHSASNMMLTAHGTYTEITSDIAPHTVGGVTTDTGAEITLQTSSASVFVTATTSEYQQFTVQRELYEYAVKELHQLATYTYEFSVEAGNFLFGRNFDQFRNELELGKGIYLNIGGLKVLTPLIEMSFSFADESKLNLIFSNRIKRHDPVNTLKDVIEKTYSTTRSIDASKHLQNQVNDQATSVSRFMNSALDAAKNRILGAGNQSVTIDGAGIHIGETTGENASRQMALVNNMIAMTDDDWEHAKLALGLFRTPENGTYFGINAEVVAGKLIVGNALIIEAPQVDAQGHPTGVMQFKVDGTGAWMDNGRLVMRNSGGGRMLIDPTNGIVAGKYNVTDGDLFTVDGTTVTPTYLDDDDEPKSNVSFMMNLQTGDAYFAGILKAKAGEIGGFTIENSYLHSAKQPGTYVELNGGAYDMTDNPNGEYALVVGNSTPSLAKFWVKKDGSMMAQDGTFMGTLEAPVLKGIMHADEDEGGWIIGPGLSIGQNATEQAGNFYVDSLGRLTISTMIDGRLQPRIYFDPIRGDYVFDGVLGTDAVFTNSLYAETGIISELTVDRLSTSRRIRKYMLGDTSDDNYIEIQDQYIKMMTGTVSSTTPVNVYNRYGSQLFWKKQPVGHNADGYPIDSDGQQIYSTTDRTNWPVQTYTYQELVKSQYAFEDLNGTYTPQLTFGAGEGSQSDPSIGKGYLRKDVDSLDLWYHVNPGSGAVDNGIFIGAYTDLVGLRKPTVLDFSGWGDGSADGSFAETLDGNVVNSFTVQFDSNGVPVKFIDAAGHETVVTW